MDRLSTLLTHFGVSAGTFHSGDFCGVTSFDGEQATGHLHLLQAGELTLKLADERVLQLNEPTLIFFPRPYRHRLFASEASGTQLVCASLEFDGGAGNALAAALPEYLVLKLDSIPTLAGTLDWLFSEAFGGICGREAMMDRLFELLVIQLLRHILTSRDQTPGMMAGLADPRLARPLSLMHDAPGKAWTVAELSAAANMSRASFADYFRSVVGQTPVDYLVSWRISLAQKRLREGKSIALIADEVGYESPSALARAFRRKTGASPREWLQDAKRPR
ncbi:MAG: AraC family transcriptional regulator [Pseudomonas sp.]|jgi:AraC-like DNA-binding protein|uniref:AraC family transcriptional regulator n=2 Tax=Pseudomonas fluorescens group TaxID=136843 RepID=A0AB36D3E6_9PSED|nr:MULTISPECIES: AraC family transcriptional regulator [Pseudomonas]MBU0522485.1 AraC family transcriptional regulator [Gammaproteobacteria bacterium]MBU0877858.1 AraC family transcriptional regulator [Alphaproteobacteria bacterium]MDF9880373.1 AraC-like DNA-binding protein [Pseudomonas silensiensis]MBU0819173.1 AraC family transcriptional regulator [Gammaproteobacteria bacterium]MBU1840970.1 AraC family transcriptional regulator [Gammaproteobacteria bacterium]